MILTDSEKSTILAEIKINGDFRKTKPKKASGRAKYVWRNVMFTVSTNPVHHCLPVTADFDLSNEDWENRREVVKMLDGFVDEIIATVPKSQWHGVHRWGRAMGMIR